MSLVSKFLICFSFALSTCAGEKYVSTRVGATPNEIFSYGDMKVPSYDFDNFEKFLQIKDNEVYVVNFWATWCQPCVEELPSFEAINTTYKHKGVNVVLVSLDSPKQVDERLFPFLIDNDIRSEVVLLADPNSNSWIPKVDPHWDGAIPITVIYNKNKRMFYERVFTVEELKAEVEKFL